MHPTLTQQIALDAQRRMLQQAANDRLVRTATAGRPSRLARLLAVAHRRTATPATRPQPSRAARSGQA